MYGIPTSYLIILIISVGAGYVTFFGSVERRENTLNTPLRDYAIAGVVIIGLIIMYFNSRASYEVTAREMVREQFALTDEVETASFEVVRHGIGSGISYSVKATYRFTDAQLRDYTATFDDPEVWKPHTMQHDSERFFGSYARRWERFPRPLRASDMVGRTTRDLPWLWNLWWEQDWKTIKNGRILCFLFQEDNGGRHPQTGKRGWHKVSACSDVPRNESQRAYVLGILDFDTNTLSAIVR